LARQGALSRPVDLQINQMREKAGLRHRAAQFARLEADRHRLLLVAIDDRRDASGAPHRPGRALAGALARLGGEAQDFGHRLVTPLSNMSRPTTEAAGPVIAPTRSRRASTQPNRLETERSSLMRKI